MTCVIIGRFQPLHKGHVSLIKQALNDHDEVKVLVCNSKIIGTKRDPFTAEERVKMLKENFGSKIKIYSITDTNNDSEWYDLIRDNVGGFDIVYSGNDWVKDIFESHGHTVISPSIIFKCNATLVRKLMSESGPYQEWLTSETIKIIDSIKGAERVKEIFSQNKDL
jgi:nicotinamide-nucleotide adenylyltransferase